MSTVRVIRKSRPSNASLETDHGVLNIPAIRPEQPQIPQIQKALSNFSQLLSLPIDSYNMSCTRPQASTSGTVEVYIQLNDCSRLTKAKTTISTFEERLRVVEEKIRVDDEKKRVEDEEKKANEETILQWETYDRLTQGLNDYVKTAVQNSQDPQVRRAQNFWSDESRFRYLPHAFSLWWIYWNATRPDLYPTLPEGLAHLTEQEKSILARTHLPSDINQAAEDLWNSEYQPLLELMLKFFHTRPKARNSIQHPQPSTTFAHALLDSNFVLPLVQDAVLRYIIDEGYRRDESGWAYLFDHID